MCDVLFCSGHGNDQRRVIVARQLALDTLQYPGVEAPVDVVGEHDPDGHRFAGQHPAGEKIFPVAHLCCRPLDEGYCLGGVPIGLPVDDPANCLVGNAAGISNRAEAWA